MFHCSIIPQLKLKLPYTHTRPTAVQQASVMPAYYLQDCHYFYRTALRGLNISTSVSPLYY